VVEGLKRTEQEAANIDQEGVEAVVLVHPNLIENSRRQFDVADLIEQASGLSNLSPNIAVIPPATSTREHAYSS